MKTLPFCYRAELDARPCIVQCDDCMKADARFEMLRRFRFYFACGAFAGLLAVAIIVGVIR